MRSEEHNARMRFGHVTEYDKIKHRAKVKFPELDDLVSDWLQIVVEHSRRDFMKDGKEHVCHCHHYGGIVKHHDECYLEIGEHVVCLMQGSGTESGVILGCVYDDKNLPES